MKYIRAILTASVVISAGAAPALAQSGETKLPHVLLGSSSQYIETYLQQLMMPFRHAAGDDQILTVEEAQRQFDLELARQRGGFMTAFFSADIDGDLRVTSEEWQAAPDNNRRHSREDTYKWDADGDGVTTVEEAYALAKQQNARDGDSWDSGRLGGYMSLAAAGDGALTAAELEQAGRAAFTHYDGNGDGVLTQQEMLRQRADSSRQRLLAVQEAKFASCDLSKPEAGQKIILLNVNEGAALSTVAVTGQAEATTTAEIRIEPGSQPLFIMAKSYDAMVWRVTGAVERVARFVVISEKDSVGVTGVKKNKIDFPADSDCLPRISSKSDIGKYTLDGLGKVLGRPVDGAYVTDELSSVVLPSQAQALDALKYQPKPDALTFSWGPLRPEQNFVTESMRRFHPAGVVQIDARDVTASHRAEAYEILPQEAGLVQLMQSGAVTYQEGRGYVVHRQIPAFPAGLAGAYGVPFVFSEGVPRLEGVPSLPRSVTARQAIEIRDRRSQLQRPRPAGQQYQITR